MNESQYLQRRGPIRTFLRTTIANQMRELLAKKEEERRSVEHMQKAYMAATDEGTTVLESGQILIHHIRANCQAPCVLHSPLPGPWEEWPRWYSEGTNQIYRVCPHDVTHPCVEQLPWLVSRGREEFLKHECCDQCVCMPRQTLPPELFTGNEIFVPQQLQGWANPKPVDDVAAVLKPGTDQINELNPNDVAIRWLYDNRLTMPSDLYITLSTVIVPGHRISSIEQYSVNTYDVSCSDECNVNVKRRNPESPWVTGREGTCPTLELALMAGWEPEHWEDELDE